MSIVRVISLQCAPDITHARKTHFPCRVHMTGSDYRLSISDICLVHTFTLHRVAYVYILIQRKLHSLPLLPGPLPSIRHLKSPEWFLKFSPIFVYLFILSSHSYISFLLSVHGTSSSVSVFLPSSSMSLPFQYFLVTPHVLMSGPICFRCSI